MAAGAAFKDAWTPDGAGRARRGLVAEDTGGSLKSRR